MLRGFIILHNKLTHKNNIYIFLLRIRNNLQTKIYVYVMNLYDNAFTN